MSTGFGTQQPKFFDDGEKLYKKEIKFEPNKSVKFIPLHGADECLTVFVHGENVYHKTTQRWLNVTAVDRNSHLLEPQENPFSAHPNEKVKKLTVKRYMLVYALQGTELDGNVGFLELKKSMYDVLKAWEVNQSEDTDEVVTVNDKRVVILRSGKGLETSYETTVVGKNEKTAKNERVETGLPEVLAEAEKVKEYLLDLYVNSYKNPKYIKELYDNHLTSAEYKAAKVKTAVKASEKEEVEEENW